MKVLITAVNKYDFTDEKSGTQVRGNSIKYTTGRSKEAENGRFLEIAEVKGNSEKVLAGLSVVPGVYDVETSVTVNAKMQPVLEIIRARFVCELELDEVIDAAGSEGLKLPAPASLNGNKVPA